MPLGKTMNKISIRVGGQTARGKTTVGLVIMQALLNAGFACTFEDDENEEDYNELYAQRLNSLQSRPDLLINIETVNFNRPLIERT
jgi:hypothetical protein